MANLNQIHSSPRSLDCIPRLINEDPFWHLQNTTGAARGTATNLGVTGEAQHRLSRQPERVQQNDDVQNMMQ